VTSQQRMLTPPRYLILSLHLSEIRCCLTLDFVIAFRIMVMFNILLTSLFCITILWKPVIEYYEDVKCYTAPVKISIQKSKGRRWANIERGVQYSSWNNCCLKEKYMSMRFKVHICTKGYAWNTITIMDILKWDTNEN
jgi:hypothetical protein